MKTPTPWYDFYKNLANYFSDKDIRSLKLDGFTIQYLMTEAYYDIFGIHDLDDPKNPLAMITYTNADSLGDLGPIAEIIGEYRNNDIHNLYGLSITDYFDLPLSVSKLLVSRSRMEKQDEEDMKEAVQENMKTLERNAQRNN